jgi:hypothetical protein
MRPRRSAPLSLALLLATGATARAADIPPSPAAVDDPGDEILRRVLRSGCREGLPDVQALADNASVAWAEPVARMCREVLRARRPPPRLALAPPTATPRRRSGTGTMIFASTIYGLWVGIATDVLFTIDGPRSAFAAPLLGMGAGVGLSVLLTGEHPLDNGQAWTVITGLEFGSVNGALWAGGLAFSSTDTVTTALATGFASGAVGLVLASTLDPRQGDVEVVRSGLTWGTATGLLAMLALSPDSSSHTYLRGAGVSMDLGFLAGLGIAASFDVSRERDLLIDAGALGGAVAGLSLVRLFVGDASAVQATAGGALAGMYAGMATALYLTRKMPPRDDDDERGPTVAAVWGRDARDRWGWGMPGATPVLDGLGHRVIGATFDAVAGVF